MTRANIITSLILNAAVSLFIIAPAQGTEPLVGEMQVDKDALEKKFQSTTLFTLGGERLSASGILG